MERVYNMDLGWKFSRGDDFQKDLKGHRQIYLSVKAGTISGPASKNFDDSGWREIDLPHDFVVESDIKEEYDEGKDHHKKGVAWYRKCFSLDAELKGKQIGICFEGIALAAKIYLNGSLIHRSFSAYSEHFIDVTDRLYVGGKVNTLVVLADSGMENFECWSYEGGGIYRHVKMYVKDKQSHIAHNGIFAYGELIDEKSKKWKLNVQTEIENVDYVDSVCAVKVAYSDGEKVIAEKTGDYVSVQKNGGKAFTTVSFDVNDPVLWDVDNPKTYSVKVSVLRDGEVVDEDSTVFGFKYYRFDPEKGFFLNGRHLKLQGISCHQDHAGVGVAQSDNLQYYRIKMLKEMGVNMYRSGHNNPAREVIDACDKLGILVMDENRHFEASEENLKHIANITKRDRNHPSVFLYCLLNEEPLQNTEEGEKIYKRLKEEVKKHDWTKMFTGAMHGNVSGAGQEMDVCGINYGYGYLDNLHKENPNVCIIGSENNSQVSTRGCLKTDREVGHVIAENDEECVPWGSTVRKNWKFARERDYMSGVTVWTGFDYHGECTMPWPTVLSQYGVIDMCGFYKGVAYFNRACYSKTPYLKLLPHWNHKEGDTVKVIAVSNCEQTELIVNGKSLGLADSDCCNPNEWVIPFEKGKIEARGYNGGKLVLTDERITAGEPKKIIIETDKKVYTNEGGDCVILNCSVVDENGVVNDVAENKLYFDVEGDAQLIGVGNGDPNAHENETIAERKLYYGRCQAIIRVKHKAKSVKITVRGDGLKSAEFVPQIENVGGAFVYSAVNNYITRLEATSASETWIDPLMKIDDDDMNTFLPLELEEGHFQQDYHKGWKLYRLLVKLPKSANGVSKERMFTLSLDDIRINRMYVFCDGRELYRKEYTHDFMTGSVNCEFTGVEGEIADIRILVHINIEKNDGCGFRKFFRIV